MNSIPEGCEKTAVCCQCYNPQESVEEYVECEICGRTVCRECNPITHEPYNHLCLSCYNAIIRVLKSKKHALTINLNKKRQLSN
jgi:hypothetical protein